MRRNHLALPYLSGLVLLVGIPAACALVLAFTRFNAISPPVFNGTDNLERMFHDALFLRAIGNTAVYALISVPLRLAAATAFALLLHRRTRGVPTARAIAYLPTVIPDAAFALLWLWVLNPLYGPLSNGISALGLNPPGFLTDPWTTRVSIAVMGAFQIGEAFVVALAARRMIPSALYESAAVDGASPLLTLRRVTLPLMTPVLLLLALRDLILALQMNFVPALLITDGGPRYATTYLPYYVYRQAFGYFRLGYASAMSVVMFLMTAIVVAIAYRVAKRYRLA